MNTNRDEGERSVENEKNGTKTGQILSQRRTSGSHPKTSTDYWKTRVCHRPGVGNGLFYARFREGTGDAWICLHTANRVAAAARARDLWVRMKAVGLDALLRELNPEPAPKSNRVGTVGEAIEAARPLSTVRPISFIGYAKRLRQVAGEIAGVPRPANPNAPSGPEVEAWRAAVDAVPLNVFTKERVMAWRAARVNAAGSDPAKRRSAEITADAAARLARAIFGRQFIEAGLGKAVNLPDPLPFAGCEWGKSHRRFVRAVDPVRLFAAARTELEKQHPQQFLALSLCLLAGLRRSEADLLTWAQVDLRRKAIRICETPYFTPKSEEATREIELDDVAVDLLRRAKGDKPDPVFVLKGTPFRRQETAAPTYRADAAPYQTWVTLLAWLRTHGLDSVTAVHALRKLAGSLVFEAHGIEQARGFLGHHDVGVTSRSYIAKTKRVVINLDPPPDQAADPRSAITPS